VPTGCCRAVGRETALRPPRWFDRRGAIPWRPSTITVAVVLLVALSSVVLRVALVVFLAVPVAAAGFVTRAELRRSGSRASWCVDHAPVSRWMRR
jgi:hypothetical protein